MLIAARGAALEVGAHPRHPGVGIVASKLQLDVLVEPLEALLAGHLWPGWAEQGVELLVAACS